MKIRAFRLKIGDLRRDLCGPLWGSLPCGKRRPSSRRPSEERVAIRLCGSPGHELGAGIILRWLLRCG